MIATNFFYQPLFNKIVNMISLDFPSLTRHFLYNLYLSSMQFRSYITLLTLLLQLLVLSTPSSPWIHKVPLKYTNNYIYYADMYFGKQSQKLSLLVDTGSRTLAAFCTLCEKGCILSEQYDVSKSSSFKNITCDNYQQVASVPCNAIKQCQKDCTTNPSVSKQCKGALSYGASQMSSFLDYLLISDQISVNQNGVKVISTFGCIYDQKNFDSGIWGLSFDPDNELLNVLYQADKKLGYAAQKLFTICTVDTDTVMNIGGVDKSFHTGQGITVKVNNMFKLWWNIIPNQIGQFTFNEKVVRNKTTSFGNFGIIVDSGTDFIIVPTEVVINTNKVLSDLCIQHSELCKFHGSYDIFAYVYELTDPKKFFSVLPPLIIELGDKQLKTPGQNYFWNMGNNYWGLGMVSAQQYGFPMSILGSTWMNNFDIVFDRQNQSLTIYPVEQCSGNNRRLQLDTDIAQTQEEYELRQQRAKFNGVQMLNSLKNKYGKGLLLTKQN